MDYRNSQNQVDLMGRSEQGEPINRIKISTQDKEETLFSYLLTHIENEVINTKNNGQRVETLMNSIGESIELETGEKHNSSQRTGIIGRLENIIFDLKRYNQGIQDYLERLNKVV